MASSNPARNSNQWQGAVFSSQDDSGITGLLGRHIELPRSAFKKILEAATQKEMKAALEHKTPLNLSIIGLPMISPDSLFAMMWISFIAIMDMTYTAYWVPINVAFCSNNYGDLNSNCTAADLAGGIVYTLHLILSFHIGTVMFHGYRKKLIMDGYLVAKIYTRHGRFLLDLISVLPFIYLVIIIAGNYVAIRWVAIVSLFRLVRLARLFSIGNVILEDIQRGDKNSPVARFFGGSLPAYLFIITFFATAIINMEGCLMVLVSNFIGKENSWMTSLDWIDIPNASSVYHWYYGIYTAIASNTSTGIFGMQLLHPGEFAVGLFLQFVGILMFTFVATVGLSAVTRASDSAMAMYRLREKLKRVNDWLSRRHVPKGLKAEILAHYHGPWMARKQAVRGDEVVSGMPRHLRDLLLQPVTHSLASSVHFFGGLGTNVRDLVAQNLVPFDVSKGVELCREGEAARCCWVMESGTILACNMKGDVHKLHAPCLFGESLFLGQHVHACRRRLWLYRSAEPCRLWRLAGSDVSMLIHLTPDIQLELMEYVQSKLIHALGHALRHPQGSSNPLFSPTSSDRGFEAAFSSGPEGDDASVLDDHMRKSIGLSGLGASSRSVRGQPAFGASDGHWCELVCAIMEAQLWQPPHIQADVLQQLIKADFEDGSLQRLLDALLAVSTLNKKAAAVLGEELPNPDKVLFARAPRSETPRSEHTRSTSWHTSTIEQPRHSVTGAWQGSHRRSTTFSGSTHDKDAFSGRASGTRGYFPSRSPSFQTAPSVLLPANTWAGGEDGSGMATGCAPVGMGGGPGGMSRRRASTMGHLRRDGGIGAEGLASAANPTGTTSGTVGGGTNVGMGTSTHSSSGVPRPSYFKCATFGGDRWRGRGHHATNSDAGNPIHRASFSSGESGVFDAGGVDRGSGGGLVTSASEAPWRSSHGAGSWNRRAPRSISRGSQLMARTRRHSSSTPGSPTASSSFLGSSLLQRLRSSRAILDTSQPPSHAAHISHPPTPSVQSDQHASPQVHAFSHPFYRTGPLAARPDPAAHSHTSHTSDSVPSSRATTAATATTSLPSSGAAAAAAAAAAAVQHSRPQPRRSISDNAMVNPLHRVHFQSPAHQPSPTLASYLPMASPAAAPSHLYHTISPTPSLPSLPAHHHRVLAHTSSLPHNDPNAPARVLMHTSSLPHTSDPHAPTMTHNNRGLVHTSSLPSTDPHAPTRTHQHRGLVHTSSLPHRAPFASYSGGVAHASTPMQHSPTAADLLHESLHPFREHQYQQQQQWQRQQQQQQQWQRQRQQREGLSSEQNAMLLRQQLQRQEHQHESIALNPDRSWHLPTIREVSFTQTLPSDVHHPHPNAQQQQQQQQQEQRFERGGSTSELHDESN